MEKIILGMTISLDGFINDQDGSVARLYPDLDALQDIEPMREAKLNTGAVVMHQLELRTLELKGIGEPVLVRVIRSV